MAELRSVSFRCRGHADIRGSHRKSVEFTQDREITARATCVLGVAADVDLRALCGFRGPLSITVEAGQHADVLHAVANPRFEAARRFVIRTTRHSDADTLAVDADKGAEALRHELLEELAQPHATVTVTVAEEPAAGRPGPGELTALAVPGAPARLDDGTRCRLDLADLIVADDPAAVSPVVAPAGAAAVVRSASAVDEDDVLALLRQGGTVVYAFPAGRRPVGVARLAQAAAAAGAAIRVPDWPSLDVTALVALGRAALPYTLLGPAGPGAESRQALLAIALASPACLVWQEDPTSLEAALRAVDAMLGSRRVAACVQLCAPQGLVLRGSASDALRQWSDLGRPPGDIVVAVAGEGGAGDGGEGGTGEAGPPGERDRLLQGLLAEGVSTRTLARALSSLPGHGYREAYRHVLELKSGGAGEEAGR